MSVVRSVGPTVALLGFGIVSTAALVVGGYSSRPVKVYTKNRARRSASLCAGLLRKLSGLMSVVSMWLERTVRIVKQTKKRGKQGRYSSCPACVAAACCLTEPSREAFFEHIIQCNACKTFLMRAGPNGWCRAVELNCKPIWNGVTTTSVNVFGVCPVCEMSYEVSTPVVHRFAATEWKT